MNGRNDLFLGLDLGGSNIRALVMDASGKIVARARRKVGTELGFDAVFEKLIVTSCEALDEAGESFAGVAGVGIGVAAQVRADSGMLAQAPNLGWQEIPLGSIMEKRIGRAVKVVNDLDAIAWAEKCFGAAQGHDDVMVVFCGTGVGGGLVLGGRPYHGAYGVACEIGHVKVASDDGELCGCGARGCLEAYVGGKNLSARLVRLANDGWSGLLELAEGKSLSIHPGMLEILADRGDSRAIKILHELGDMLGDVLANAVTVLNLSAVVLGGTVLEGCPTMRQRTQLRLLSRVLNIASENLAVLDDRLGDWAGAMGAAALQ